ncbi:MAG: hypothetical protein OEZ39_20205, partial [Gammaproteobacteria bacterium]|nr:hypothetical protein [Gammaproteobacteria bacterium]
MPGATLTLDNNVPVPSSPSALGGPVKQTFGYDELYRLTTANGDYEYSSGKHFRYTLNMQYDNIHNIVRKEQTSTNESAGKVQTRTEGTYSWDYAYDGKQPHAPTHIGERTFSYDANGNQTGWTHDNKGARRAIEWDDENRIMVVKDAGSTLDFVYDESGTRLVKRGQYGKTVYVNKFYVVTNGSTVSKHIYAGTTRLATQLVTGEQADKVRTGGGQTTTYSTTTATTTSTGGTATVDTGTTTASSTTGQGSATVDTQATTTATADVATQTGNGKD